ncbi:MAG: hypothetical protein AB1443_01835 [Pseudomonadota bacterium]
MRILFLVLLLANMILFAWGQGHLGTQEAGREPQRIAQQVAPEKLRILPAGFVKPAAGGEAAPAEQ